MKTILIQCSVITCSVIAFGADAPVDKENELFAPKYDIKLNAFPMMIPDGTAVVLKKEGSVGVVFISKQITGPEQCTFTWLLRTDGKLNFAPKSEGLQEGVKENSKSLRFGPFSLEWSMGSEGIGWIYFPSDGSYMGIAVDATRENISTKLPMVPMIRNIRGDKFDL